MSGTFLAKVVMTRMMTTPTQATTQQLTITLSPLLQTSSPLQLTILTSSPQLMMMNSTVRPMRGPRARNGPSFTNKVKVKMWRPSHGGNSLPTYRLRSWTSSKMGRGILCPVEGCWATPPESLRQSLLCLALDRNVQLHGASGQEYGVQAKILQSSWGICNWGGSCCPIPWLLHCKDAQWQRKQLRLLEHTWLPKGGSATEKTKQHVQHLLDYLPPSHLNTTIRFQAPAMTIFNIHSAISQNPEHAAELGGHFFLGNPNAGEPVFLNDTIFDNCGIVK